MVIAALLACIAAQDSLAARGAKRYLTKESKADMSGMRSIFLGWVDLVPEDWAVHGYDDKAEWNVAVNRLNNAFQRLCQTKWLSGRAVAGAKERGDESAAGQDLHIKFTDVRIDYNNYLLYLSIHFIDGKTNAELASIPVRAYYGNDWGFERYLRAALEEVNLKIQVEVAGAAAKK
jgi:hypothetical protein